MKAESAEQKDGDTSPVDDRPFIKATSEAKNQYGRFNLAIIGNTGVGKSSLVNAVFGREHAKVGKGLPVTRGVNYYHDDSLGVWDFEGFEIGSSRSPAETLRGHLQTVSERPKDEQIAVVWYCVLHNADRLTDPDVAMISRARRCGPSRHRGADQGGLDEEPGHRHIQGTERYRDVPAMA